MTVVEHYSRGLAVGAGATLGFAVVWATVSGSAAIAVGAGVLLVSLVGLLVIAPDRLRLSGGGIDAEMERRQRERIAEVLETSLEQPAAQHPPNGLEVPETTVPPIERGMGSTISRPALKRFAEDLITESAEWGWMMGQMGFRTVPRPVIEWTGDQPRIMYGKGDPNGPRGGNLAGTESPGYDKPNGT